MNNSRVKYIDIAKGIAIICIILGHLGINAINRLVFTFHVPIFFIITGYFLRDERTLTNEIRIKARTLLIPYVITCIFMIAFAYIRGAFYNAADSEFVDWTFAALYGAGDDHNEIFYIKGIGARWFLWATFWGCVFLKILLKTNHFIRILGVTILFLLGTLTKEIIWLPFSIQAGATATLYIYLGYLVNSQKEVFRKASLELKIVAMILSLAMWLEFIYNFKSFWLVHCDVGRGLVDLFGSICGCFIVLLISVALDKWGLFVGNALAYIGRYSLFVLCIHSIELNILPWNYLMDIFVKKGMPIDLRLGCTVLLKLILDIGLAIICSRIKTFRKIFGMER